MSGYMSGVIFLHASILYKNPHFKDGYLSNLRRIIFHIIKVI